MASLSSGMVSIVLTLVQINREEDPSAKRQKFAIAREKVRMHYLEESKRLRKARHHEIRRWGSPWSQGWRPWRPMPVLKRPRRQSPNKIWTSLSNARYLPRS